MSSVAAASSQDSGNSLFTSEVKERGPGLSSESPTAPSKFIAVFAAQGRMLQARHNRVLDERFAILLRVSFANCESAVGTEQHFLLAWPPGDSRLQKLETERGLSNQPAQLSK